MALPQLYPKSDMRRFLLFSLIYSLCYLHTVAQCRIPQGGGDTITPVTNNYYLDTPYYATGLEKTRVFNITRMGDQFYLSGSFTNIGPGHGSGVVLDSASKGLISTKAWKINGNVRASIPDGHGGFYIAGDFTKIGDSVRDHIAQIDAMGRPTPWKLHVDRPIYTLYKTNDTLLLGGAFSNIGNATRYLFAGYSLSGDSVLPYRLGIDTSVTDGVVYAIKPHGINKVFIGGNIRLGFTNNSQILEYDLTKGILTTWAPDIPIFGNVSSIDISQDGKTVFCAEGSWNKVRANDIATGHQLYTVTLYDEEGGFNGNSPNGGGAVSLKVLGNSLYIAGVYFQVGTASGIAYRNGLCAINTSTGALQDFDLRLNAKYITYVDAFNGNLVVSGLFTQAGNLSREHFLMVDTTTMTITDWNPSPSDDVKTMSISAGKIFLGGIFNGIGSVHRNGMAAFDATTGAILPFNPPGNDILMTKKLAIRGDTLFVLGRTDEPDVSAYGRTAFLLYRISTSTPIAVTSNLGFSHMQDFLLDDYLYAAVDFNVRRFTLPGLHLDAVWKADFSNGPTNHTPMSLCKDSTAIYSVGDTRVSSNVIYP